MHKKLLLTILFYGLSINHGFSATPFDGVASNAPLSIIFNGADPYIFLGVGDQVRVSYFIRNRDTAPHRIFFNNTYPAGAVSQLSNVPDSCNFSIPLAANATCQLGLLITGNQLSRGVTTGGPQICIGTTANVCSRPPATDILTITRV